MSTQNIQEKIQTTSTTQVPIETFTERIERPTIIRETIIPQEKIEVQPIIYREREQKEIHQIVQPMTQKEYRTTLVEHRDLPAEVRAETRLGEGYQRGPSKFTSSYETEPVQVERTVKPTIVREHVTRKVVEEVQPVLYREVVQPTLVEQVQPIEEKIVEAPVLVEERLGREPIRETVSRKYPSVQGQILSLRIPTEFLSQYGNRPLVVVLGATGKQGGAIVRSLLRDGRWTVRAVTRNISKANELKALGAEIFVGNMLNLDSLRMMMQGAYAVFAVTNFWDPEIMNREEDVGKRIALAAYEAGVKHYIWSTLPNAEKISRGKYHVPHFTGKARVNKYIKSLGFPFYSFVVLGFYYQNFLDFFTPRLEGDTLVWTLPISDSAYLTTVDVRDVGPAVLSILLDPVNFSGKKYFLAAEHMHPQDYILRMGLQLGRKMKAELVAPDIYLRSGFPNAHEIVHMFSYMEEFLFFGQYDWTISRRLFPLTSWEQFVSEVALPKFGRLQEPRVYYEKRFEGIAPQRELIYSSR